MIVDLPINLLPLIFILTACINIGEFSFFDISFLPLFYIYFFKEIFIDLKIKKPQNIFMFIFYIFVIISFISNFSNSTIITNIGVSLRSVLFFITTTLFFYFFKKKIENKNIPEVFILKLITFTGSVLVTFSLIQFKFLDLPRFSYPLTFEGVDPHLYGISLMSLFVITFSLITNSLISKISTIQLSIFTFQIGLILLGALLTGSRGVFLYGFIALIPNILNYVKRFFKNIRISKKLLISLTILFFITTFAFLNIDIFQERFIQKAFRVFEINKFISGDDVSRSELIKDIITILETPSSYTFFGQELKQTLTDSGLLFYLLNFGVFGLISFNLALLSIAFPRFLLVNNFIHTSMQTKFHILGLLFYNLISSESIFFRTFTLLLFLTTTGFVLLENINQFNKNNYLYK